MVNLSFNKLADKRNAYFQSRNLATPPLSQEDRYYAALGYMASPLPDFEAAYMLYDKLEDIDHSGFAKLMASIHSNEKSPYYDINKTNYFYRRLSALTEVEGEKIKIAEDYLEYFIRGNVATPEEYHKISGDQIAVDALFLLNQHNIEPKAFRAKDNQKLSAYFLISLMARGHGKADAKDIIQEAYRLYIEESEAGYLSHAYQNLAARYALGIGGEIDIDKAVRMIRTGRIIFNQPADIVKDPLNPAAYTVEDSLYRAILSIKDHMRSADYQSAYYEVIDNYNKKKIPWSMIDIISKSQKNYDIYRRAITDSLSVFSSLAQAEQWENHEHWKQIYQYACLNLNKFITQSDHKIINSSLKIHAPVQFRQEILEQEPGKLSIRLPRIKMYEHFQDFFLGIPPVNSADRYRLSIDYLNKPFPQYKTALVLYDEEEDKDHKDWQFLAGHIYDSPDNISYDEKTALSFYHRALSLGSGHAAYRIGIKYEQGNIVDLNLDTAWHYFQKAEQLGYQPSGDIYEKVKTVVRKMDEFSYGDSVRNKIYEIYKRYRHNLVDDIPVTSEERLKEALKFIYMVPPQYRDALNFYIEEVDIKNSNWLLLGGFIHDDHLNNEEFYDPELAFDLFKKSSKMGNPTASFNLGVKYHNGNEVEIDLNEALEWFELSKKQGNDGANYIIAEIKLFQQSLEKPEKEAMPDEKIAQLYLEGFVTGSLLCGNMYAQCSLNGTGIKRSEQAAIEFWRILLTMTPAFNEETIHACVAYKMAVRSFLGLGVERDLKKSIDYLNLIPDQSNHGAIRYYLQECKKLLTHYIYSEIGATNSDLELVQHLYANPQDIQKTIQNMEWNFFKASSRLTNYVICAHWLAKDEMWQSRYDWDNFLEATQAHKLKIPFNKAVQSTRDSGPRYNQLDARGLPILGALMKPSVNQGEEESQKSATGSYVPQPGLIRLKAIRGKPDGFTYLGDYSEDFPAMLTLEDKQISEILVFGDPYKGPLFPSLSLETENNDKLGHGAEGSGYEKALLYKVFNPQWLAYTDFGRTLWITDYLIGQWCWNPEKFQVAPPDSCASPRLHFLARDFIKDLRLTGGRDGGGRSARVMIQPKSNYISSEAPQTVYKQESAEVKIMQMTMKVYGSYNDGNTENRSLFEEDPNFEQGRTVKKLTDRYNDIMQLDPRFERAQQLMGLFYGHLRLWEIGYRPSDALQRELTSRLRGMESLGRDKDERLLVRRAFGLRPY